MDAGIKEAYAKLKIQLTQNKSRIVAEEPPKYVSAIQGSLWGISPKTAQKKMTYTLQQDTSGTHITSTSSLTSGYINLTLVGCALSIVLMLLCAWIAMDLQAYASIGVQGFWSWLAQIHGHVDPDEAAMFIKLGWIFTVFLAASLVAEGIIVAHVRAKIGAFAEETLKTL